MRTKKSSKLLNVAIVERERTYHAWTQKETLHLIKLYNSMCKLHDKKVDIKTIREFIKRFPHGHFTETQVRVKLMTLKKVKENTGFKSLTVDSITFNLQ